MTQTDRESVKDIVTQTDRESVKDIVTQTDRESVKDIVTQTDRESVKDIVTQTDRESVEKLDKNVGTDNSNFMNLLITDCDLKAFTGIKFCVLRALVKSIELIQKKVNDKNVCTLKERVVLTLCKLKLCLSYDCLAVLFGISRSTVGHYFSETIHLLASVLEEAVYFPDKEEIQQNMPVYLKIFQNTRIVLDCTEVPVENSKCLQ